jgi:hypothetical protein
MGLVEDAGIVVGQAGQAVFQVHRPGGPIRAIDDYAFLRMVEPDVDAGFGKAETGGLRVQPEVPSRLDTAVARRVLRREQDRRLDVATFGRDRAADTRFGDAQAIRRKRRRDDAERVSTIARIPRAKRGGARRPSGVGKSQSRMSACAPIAASRRQHFPQAVGCVEGDETATERPRRRAGSNSRSLEHRVLSTVRRFRAPDGDSKCPSGLATRQPAAATSRARRGVGVKGYIGSEFPLVRTEPAICPAASGQRFDLECATWRGQQGNFHRSHHASIPGGERLALLRR